MTESGLLEAIIAECASRGLLVHHCRDSRYCEGTPGIPDLIIASFKGVIFAELKSAVGDTSADQDLWRYALYRVSHPSRGYPPVITELQSVQYRLWRPEHWDAGTIQDHLARLASP